MYNVIQFSLLVCDTTNLNKNRNIEDDVKLEEFTFLT